MFGQQEDQILVEASPLPIQEIPEDRALTETKLPATVTPDLKIPKAEIRTSLKALTTEGAFATVFYSIIGGALLSNFLLDLGASTVEIGLLASIPQLTNLLQPLGAFLGDRIKSRHWYSFLIFGSSRLPWLLIVPGIWLVSTSRIQPRQLVLLTLAIICLSNFMEALGRASFLSWMAVLVPERLRGRYFGLRNSVVTLTNLIGVPLLGLTVSKWPGGSLQGFGAVLVLGVVFATLSLVFQFWITDVNPQLVHAADSDTDHSSPWRKIFSFLKDGNFLRFLFYSALWSFAVNISAPFFNLYLLGDLNLDVSVVTLYNSLGAGANLLMLMFWGKLADRIGNRPLMISVGILVALTPLLWLEAGTAPIFLWAWFPLLHILGGATWAAIDLCSGNLMMGVTPLRNQSIYFAIAAAVPGITGAMGIAAGGYVATVTDFGGLPTAFALSAVLRLLALLPLVFVHERRSVRVRQLMKVLIPTLKRQAGAIQAGRTSLKPLPLIESEKEGSPASSSAQS
ncbi:MFS transporter [Funiculus sociatus GB2-A5]|uniref:MFS transporter n=1 Tax=Funiculus sociatus GB2-A5 TaxID=2933946 RepID=A0ABV0JMZ7_9CYAN|nr:MULTISPECIES: MFS transporter [unclassified Trichocoleus]MBD1907807.1 MFS transporter [Trichocoleus sp. FACHB-832]MBD2063985.1 MFS transporter [Trichocoleus sp. FACHB-6]